MHIERLKLTDFRNLREVKITFPSSAEGPDGKPIAFHSHAIIGENGSGKSNLLEALITIFRDLDLDTAAAIDYELVYQIQDRDKNTYRVELAGQKGKKPTVVINGQKSHLKELIENPNTYLPAHIFAYYSGKNERVEALFQPHLQRFNQLMRLAGQEQVPSSILVNFSGSEAAAEALQKRQRARESRRRKLGEDLLRRLFYCRGGHTQLVLLACFLSDDPVFKQILKDLHIEEIDSALFVLKRPHYLRPEVPEPNIQNGDSRFWFAAGTVVSEFLANLWEVAIAPIDETVDRQIDFRGDKMRQEQLYLFVPNKDKLKQLGDLVGTPEAFFRYAEGAYIGDLIEEVRINVKHKDVAGNITSTQLSEGELQLLTVLGLMRITNQDNCLFLLDEPDTHLNPIWKLRYFEQIDNVLHHDGGESLKGTSQIIITTHDPLMIGSLRKEQVRIFNCRAGDVSVREPTEHPQGMGVAGLLKSEMFGLPSTLDRPTLEKLQRRNDLLALRNKGTLKPKQEADLKQLREYLDGLGFPSEYRDPLYKLFIEKMYEVRSQPLGKLLSPEELKEQEALARQIVTKIVKQEKTEQLSDLARELSIAIKQEQ